MNRKRNKLFLFCFIATLLVGCGGGSEKEEVSSTTTTNQYVYKENIINVDLKDTRISDIVYKDNYIYVQGLVSSSDDSLMPRMENMQMVTMEELPGDGTPTPDGEMTQGTEQAQKNTYFIGKYDTEGTKISSFEVTLESGQYLSKMVRGEENQYLLLIVQTANYENEENATDKYFLRSYDESGATIFEIELKGKAEDTAFMVNNIASIKNQVLIAGSEQLLFYSLKGELENEIALGDNSNAEIIISKNEDIYLRVWNESGVLLKKVEKEKKSIGEAIELPFTGYQYTFFPGKDHDFLLSDSTGVYGYNLGEEQIVPILNYIDSDMNISSISYMRAMDDTTFFAYYYNDETQEQVISKLTKVNPEDVVKKETITLGAWYLDLDVKKQVIQFNKTNETHRIKIIDYSIYNTQDDYSAGLTKLNTDIIAGTMPDILLLNPNMPVKSYMAKGLFTDFYALMDKDSTIKRSDFLENIFEATSYNGKLYQLIPNFSVNTVVGKTSDVGATLGFTLDDLKAMVAKKEDSVEIFAETTRANMLYYFLTVNNAQFINWETGKCSFDTKEFQDVLEFVNKMPAEIDFSSEDYWKNYDSKFRTGSALLKITSLSNFRDYNSLKKGEFGEDITLIGFPTSEKNGSAISYNLSFAISEKSNNKEGAWNFVRYFLSDEYQATNTYNWPIKISQIEANAKESMKKPSYTDEFGKEVFYDQTYYIGGTEIVLEELTQDEIDTVTNFIKSINKVMTDDTNLTKIINEEAESYFSGQKSVIEVSNIIQSRVQIYVNENR